jgi:hypothetical protein
MKLAVSGSPASKTSIQSSKASIQPSVNNPALEASAYPSTILPSLNIPQTHPHHLLLYQPTNITPKIK